MGEPSGSMMEWVDGRLNLECWYCLMCVSVTNNQKEEANEEF